LDSLYNSSRRDLRGVSLEIALRPRCPAAALIDQDNLPLLRVEESPAHQMLYIKGSTLNVLRQFFYAIVPFRAYRRGKDRMSDEWSRRPRCLRVIGPASGSGASMDEKGNARRRHVAINLNIISALLAGRINRISRMKARIYFAKAVLK
jgi:hypothetical protein